MSPEGTKRLVRGVVERKMTIRQKLIKVTKKNGDPFEIIWNLDPKTCSEKDVRNLLNIRKAKPSDPLAHLGLEADLWLRTNLKILKERFQVNHRSERK